MDFLPVLFGYEDTDEEAERFHDEADGLSEIVWFIAQARYIADFFRTVDGQPFEENFCPWIFAHQHDRWNTPEVVAAKG